MGYALKESSSTTKVLPEQLSLEASPAQAKTPNKAKSGLWVSSRDEMNLAEFPLAVLSTRVNPKIKTLEFKDSQRTRGGDIIERKWIITGADKFGLPTATDDDVILGLMRLSMDQGFSQPKVYFTRYELLKILRWTTEGRSYRRLTKSLDRLSGVRVRASNAFYDNSSKSYQTKNFGIIDAYEINDERAKKSSLSEGEPPKSYFIWSEVLFDSFKVGFIKKLDLEFYFELKSSVARRLYRFLDKHFYFRRTVEKPLVQLAFEKIGLSRNYKYLSSIKQQLEPSLDELIAVGFLESYSYSGTGPATTIKMVAKANLAPNSQPKQEPKPAPKEANIPIKQAPKPQAAKLPPECHRLVEALLSRGLNVKQAKHLLEEKPPSALKKIEDIIRYYDFLVESKDHKISKNRIGFLYRAVESPFKFDIPKAFLINNTPQTPNNRPELKPFSSTRQTRELTAQAAKQEHLKTKLRELKSKLPPQELASLRAQVLENMQSLKGVLGEKKFAEALEGCIEQELKKRYALQDFN